MLIRQAKLFNVKNLIVTSKKHYEILKKNRNKNIKIYNNFYHSIKYLIQKLIM